MKKRRLLVGFMILFIFAIGFVSNHFWNEVGTDFMVLSVEE